MRDRTAALQYLRETLGENAVVTGYDALSRATDNTLGVERDIAGIVYPASTMEVAVVVEAANRFRLPIYPISRGRNTGYGDCVPPTDGQVIVDLSRMNSIREFDNELGTISIEPGVTQEQLYRFLMDSDSRFWMDVTGAGLDSSIAGNTLDGGFGHTPVGFRRQNLSDIEIVCGNGEIFNTGDKLDYGPDMAGLFVQSNLGVVTALKTRLTPIPEVYKSFVIKVPTDEGLELLVERLRKLRQEGTLTSLVHVANAMRSLITTRDFPEGYDDKLITCEQAMDLMQAPLLKVGYWTAIGGLYGSKDEIRAKEKKVKQSMDGVGRVIFLDAQKIDWLSFLGRFCKPIGDSLDSLRYVHGLGMGTPNDKQLQNIKWRVSGYKDMGLMWYSPKAPAKGKYARIIVETASRLYREHGFEFPITLTLVTSEHITGVLSISFNKNDHVEKGRAESLYSALREKLGIYGIQPYRFGVNTMEGLTFQDKGKDLILRKIKRVFDPNNIIAPGRYGL